MSSMPAFVWMNGVLVPTHEARVSPFDTGFTLGEGVFETLVDRGAGPVALHRHWLRLQRSCEVLRLPVPSLEQLQTAFHEVMRGNACTSARLRFTITRGEPGAAGPTMIAVATNLHQWPAAEHVRTVAWPRNERSPLVSVKCSSYAENVLALAQAKSAGAGEAIFANTRGELCEGTGSNVFIVRDGVICTPPLSAGCLPGVTREVVIEACLQAELPVEERVLSMRDFLDAEEAFLTSSTRDVHPIASIDGRALAQCPGELTLAAGRAYAELMLREQ